MFSIKDDKDLPYDFISSPSRINFAIIEKTEQGSKVCDVNLTKEEISDLFDQTKILYDIYIKKEMGFYDKGENNNSPCYTETFKMGSLKGKTPAQVGDVQTLKSQKAFLLPNVSIFRNEDSLRTAKAELEILKKKFLRDTKCSGIAEYEFKNMLLVSELIIQAALTREESRGAHYRTDFLTENDVAEHSQLINEKGELVFVK